MVAAGQKSGQAAATLPGLADAQSQLAMPLLVKDALVGVLAVESRTPNAFNDLDEVLLRIVGNQAATAIDNARSYQMVEKLGRLKRFFSPQLAEMIVRGGADDPLKTHRKDGGRRAPHPEGHGAAAAGVQCGRAEAGDHAPHRLDAVRGTRSGVT